MIHVYLPTLPAVAATARKLSYLSPRKRVCLIWIDKG